MLVAGTASADDLADAGTGTGSAAAGGATMNGDKDFSLALGASETTIGEPMPGMQLLGTTQRSVEGTMPSESTFEPSMLFSLRYRLGERVVWSAPTLSFAYLGGDPRGTEWIPWGGLTSWGAGYSSIQHLIVDGSLGAGIGVRQWLGSELSLNATAGASQQFEYASLVECPTDQMCDHVLWPKPRGTATVGATYRLTPSVTVNAGVGASTQLGGDETTVSFGSVQSLGLRTLPLVEARINSRWSVDGYAAAAYDRTRSRYEQTYLLGVTRVWSH
jgi:hypothetical protein